MSEKKAKQDRAEGKAPPAKKIVKDQEQKPCGCSKLTYADDTVGIQPCVEHALLNTAEMLSKSAHAMAEAAQCQQLAAQALGAGASRLLAQKSSANMGKMISEIANGDKKQ